VPLGYEESIGKQTMSGVKVVKSVMKTVQAYTTTRAILNAMIMLSFSILLK
jgi:hypothetical protein